MWKTRIHPHHITSHPNVARRFLNPFRLGIGILPNELAFFAPMVVKRHLLNNPIPKIMGLSGGENLSL